MSYERLGGLIERGSVDLGLCETHFMCKIEGILRTSRDLHNHCDNFYRFYRLLIERLLKLYKVE